MFGLHFWYHPMYVFQVTGLRAHTGIVGSSMLPMAGSQTPPCMCYILFLNTWFYLQKDGKQSTINTTIMLRSCCPWQIIGSLRITNIDGNINRNLQNLFKMSAAWLVFNNFLTFVFPFIFVIHKLPNVLWPPNKRSWPYILHADYVE